MPRSHGALKVSVWEVGSDYRALSLDAQWAYQMLISQPQINNCGLLPYTPEKWWRFAGDLTRDRLHAALQELEDARLTITDVDTGELLIRTFVKHDGVWKHSKLVTNARKLIREIESPAIRRYLLERHPWLIDGTWTTKKIETHETRGQAAPPTPRQHVENHRNGASEKPQTDGEHEPQTDGQTDAQPEGETEGEHDGQSPLRARVRDGLGLDLDQDQRLRTSVSYPRAVALQPTAPTAQGQHIIKTITPNLPEIP